MQDKTMSQANKMGVMPIRKLLFSMSLPMIISMIVQALYNIVDSIYVSQIAESALTAVTLAFPIQNLMIAVISGTAVGVNALLSRSLGQKNHAEANRAANNGVMLAAVEMLIFVIFGIFGTGMYFRSQTTDPEIINYGIQYLSICLIASGGLYGEIMFERLLQSTGKTFYTMITQGIGAVLNILLDPIFIFGWGFIPAMGTRGAAIATVIGQIVAMLLALFFNLKRNGEIKLRIRDMKPNFKTIKAIFSVGLPSMVMMSISSVMTYGMNRILLAFSSTAATVFGLYYKLQSFVFMPIFGLNNGAVPIIAYNYGARNKARIMETIKLAVITATSFMMIGIIACQLFPGTLLQMFNASDNMIAIGEKALRINSISFIFAGFCVVAASVFQAMGKGSYSLYTSIARQLAVLLPVAYLLSLTGKLEAVWWSFPIAEIASVGASAFYLNRIYKERIKPLEQPVIQDEMAEAVAIGD